MKTSKTEKKKSLIKSHKLACADFTFPLLPHDASLDVIALLEFDGVDIGLFEGRSHLWPSREFKATGQAGRELKRKVEDRGLEVADVFLQMAPDFVPYAINHSQAGRRRKARNWFLKTLEYARECGSKHVTTLPGVLFPHEPKSMSWGRALDELAWRVARAQEQGIVYGTEAHVGSLAPTPKAAAKLIQHVPGLTLTLDYTHFARIGLPDSEVEPLLQYASHFHVRGARKGRLQTSFQDNTINYRDVLRTIKKNSYSGFIGIEYIWIDWEHCNDVDNLSETVLFRDYVRAELARNASRTVRKTE